MTNRVRKRILAFERLEAKSTPTSLLLALAPLDETFHVTVEQMRDDEVPGHQCLDVDTSANWQFQISTHQLLCFVEENTSCRVEDVSPVARPSAEQCQRVDEMMKLDDVDTRVLILAESYSSE